MSSKLKSWQKSHPIAKWLYPVLFTVTLSFFIHSCITGRNYLFSFLSISLLILYIFRPHSAIYRYILEKITWKGRLLIVFAAFLTILTCILPMSQFKLWNGENPEHRNQYELLAESLYNGRIDIPYNDDEALSQLENPYSPEERKQAGVTFHWDHAYYNGHYYMYFGVVPALLVFLPYRAITGHALTTYHATQLFTALAIIGIFILFFFLARRFFKKLPLAIYLALSVAFSFISLWLCAIEPALYCTAISSGLAFSIWSLFFFIYAVYGEKRLNRQILFASIGAIFGALVFGCRPPIALSNLLVIPLFITFLKQHKFTPKLFAKILFVALPYLAIGIALMYYNYVRFDSLFEFGQSYQLTVADQHNYGFHIDSTTLLRFIKEEPPIFFEFKPIEETFPYIHTGGVFINFPILLLCLLIFSSKIRQKLRQHNLLPLVVGLFITVLIISLFEILWSPYIIERYHFDFYYLLGILCFILVGFWYQTSNHKQQSFINCFIIVLAFITLISTFLFCVRFTSSYQPEIIESLSKFLLF